jgi:diguanylate cyclase (GGDEF)-like protein
MRGLRTAVSVREAETRGGNRFFRASHHWKGLGAAFGGCVGLLVLFGYAVGLTFLWRPIPCVGATNPTTALSLAFLGFGLTMGFSSNRRARQSGRVAIIAVSGFLVLCIGSNFFGTGLIDMLTPFVDEVDRDRPTGSHHMSVNAGFTLLAIAGAEISRWYGRPTLCQTLAVFSICGFFIALIGYLIDLWEFQGGMAPFTLLGAIPLAMAVLFAEPESGFIRVLAARSESGTLARLLVSVSTAFVLLVGWLVSRHVTEGSIGQSNDGALLVYETAGIIGLTWVLVIIGVMRADRIENSQRAAEQLLIHAATTDALTGLLTRNKMTELYLGPDLRENPPIGAKLFIGLDRFRLLNEAFGHVAGDEILKEVGRRLSFIFREHYVSRFGGDEFSVYCVGITQEEATQAGMAVTKILARPFEVLGLQHHLTASVGVAHTDIAGGMDLRQAADAAMFVAKQRGGNQTVVFEWFMHETVKAQVELEQELHKAVHSDCELSLSYQPVVRLADNSLYALESLVRWDHPRLGPVSPGRFIPIAEATGLIIPLGLKVIDLTVRQAALWHSRYPNENFITNINISPIQFNSSDVIGDFLRFLERHQLPTNRFCIELTEGAFANENTILALKAARQHGFKVAMDDFGVGYSSLSLLPRLPLSSIKLDRSFIVNAAESPGDALLLSTITQLAHALNLTVVAEGVERQDQLAIVTKYGCDAVQGYIHSRPLVVEDVELYLSGKMRWNALM